MQLILSGALGWNNNALANKIRPEIPGSVGRPPSQEYQRDLKTERVYQTGPVSRPNHRQIIRTIIKEFTA